MSGPAPDPFAGVESTAFSPAAYQAMLDEVRAYLPLFLQPGASEHDDPLGDLEGITGLHREDLRRVIATHVCLDDAVRRFCATLPDALRRPITSSVRPVEATQAVRGPIDWGATTRLRAGAGGNATLYAVRPGRRVFDTEENQTLAWVLAQLEVQAARALRLVARQPPGSEERGWRLELAEVLRAARRAWRVDWLSDVQPRRPDARTFTRLARARSRFYRTHVASVARLLQQAGSPDEATLTEILCRRHFVPDRAWRLFEVLVALRLARAFAQRSGAPRLARLLAGADGASPYARYRLPGGDEVQLIYQGWPAGAGASTRRRVAQRHGFVPATSQPDLMIRRLGAAPDCVVLELKATRSGGYLGDGLSQLLGYLADRPQAFGPAPAGWLVAPASAAFTAAEPDPAEPLWVVAAESVADALVKRMA